ncbi:MAG: glycosyltransferase family 4 protein [Promethearchaeota archaeon]
MKILSVNASGGISREGTAWHRISTIGEYLRSRGHDVKYIHYYAESTDYSKVGKEELGKHIFAPSPVHISLLKHLSVLKSGNYDLVYANTHYGALRAMLGKLVRPRVPLILDAHGGLVEEYLMSRTSSLRDSALYVLMKFVDALTTKFSDEIFCVSKKMVKRLRKRGVPAEKLHYVTNGVDLQFFSPRSREEIEGFRKKLGLEGKFIVGYLGKFQKWQGVDKLLEAGRELEDPEIIWLFVGGRDSFREKNIISVPRVPRSRVPDYYSICDVLALPRPAHPATEIAAPTKFAEYIAMGKPVLTTSVGDAALFVREHQCGLVVPDNSVPSLIRGIRELHSKTGTELERMGANARELAEAEFDWKKIGEKIAKIIERYSKNES